MRIWILLFFAACAQTAGAGSHYFTGKFIERAGRLYLVESPTAGGQGYEVQWKKGAKPAKICRWNVSQTCPQYTLYFSRLAHQKGRSVMIDAYVGILRPR